MWSGQGLLVGGSLSQCNVTKPYFNMCIVFTLHLSYDHETYIPRMEDKHE